MKKKSPTTKPAANSDPFTDAIRHAVEDVVRRCVQERLREVAAFIDDRLADHSAKCEQAIGRIEKQIAQIADDANKSIQGIHPKIEASLIRVCTIHESRSKTAIQNMVKVRDQIEKKLLESFTESDDGNPQ